MQISFDSILTRLNSHSATALTPVYYFCTQVRVNKALATSVEDFRQAIGNSRRVAVRSTHLTAATPS